MSGDLTAGQINLSRGLKLPPYDGELNFPTTTDVGLMIFDSVTLKPYVWTGDPEDPVTPGGGWVAVGGNVVLGGNKSLGFNYGSVSTRVAGSSSANISSTSGPLGTEFMSVTYTPSNASSNLYITCTIPWMGETTNHSDHFTFGLYKDSNSTALALWYADDRYQDNNDGATVYMSSANHQCWLYLSFVEPAGSAAARTYRLRGGCNGGAVAINGSSQSLPGLGTFANIQSNILIYEFEAN